MNLIKVLEQFVFWYPVIMGSMWVIGSIIFYNRIEKKDPLPLNDVPMVSILVPCYNEEKNIMSTISHLEEIIYPNFEIIAINDGSTDNTVKILTRLAHKYQNLRLIDCKENCGKANALDIGVIAARSEILVTIDADAYLEPDALNYIVAHFTNKHNGERVGAVTGNPRVRNRSSLLAKIQLCEYSSIVSLTKRTQRILGKVMTVSGVVAAFRKTALMSVHFWDRDVITEDIGVTWKLEKNFWDVRYEPKAKCWMLVPETFKGLWKQRLRWAQGGLEVMGRHADIFRNYKERRFYPIYLEQLISITWSICWFALTIYEFSMYGLGKASLMDNFWKCQFLSFVCVVQSFVAVKVDSHNDENLLKGYIWAAWYPVFYWYINAFVILFAIPKTIFKKRGLARWSSPDRGIGTEDTTEDVENNGLVVDGSTQETGVLVNSYVGKGDMP